MMENITNLSGSTDKSKGSLILGSTTSKRKTSFQFSSSKAIEKYIDTKLKENETGTGIRLSITPPLLDKLQKGKTTESTNPKRSSYDSMTTLSSKSSTSSQAIRVNSNKSLNTKSTSVQICQSPNNSSNETAKIIFDDCISPIENTPDVMNRLEEIKTSLVELINEAKDKTAITKEIELIYKKCHTNKIDCDVLNIHSMQGLKIEGSFASSSAESLKIENERLKRDNASLKIKLTDLSNVLHHLTGENVQSTKPPIIKSDIFNRPITSTPVNNFNKSTLCSQIPEILNLSDSYDGLVPDDKPCRLTIGSKNQNHTNSFLLSVNQMHRPIGKVQLGRQIDRTPKKKSLQPDVGILFRNKSFNGGNIFSKAKHKDDLNAINKKCSEETYVQLTIDDEGNEMEVANLEKRSSKQLF